MSCQWYLLYTLSNYEKKAYDLLQRKNITAYLPTNVEHRRWSDRIKKMTVPLFPNYLFVHITEREATSVLQTHGILKFVSFGGKRAIIPLTEIELIEKISSGGISMEVNEILEEGDLVEIERGPFKGLRGILFEKRGNMRFGINLLSLGKNISISISASHLKKVKIP